MLLISFYIFFKWNVVSHLSYRNIFQLNLNLDFANFILQLFWHFPSKSMGKLIFYAFQHLHMKVYENILLISLLMLPLHKCHAFISKQLMLFISTYNKILILVSALHLFCTVGVDTTPKQIIMLFFCFSKKYSVILFYLLNSQIRMNILKFISVENASKIIQKKMLPTYLNIQNRRE